MIALPARDDDYDYAFFGRETDADHPDELRPALANLAARDRLRRRTGSWRICGRSRDVVPAQKIVVGIANYAYDWTETSKKEEQHAEEFSIQEALLHAHESETDVEFDSASLNPHYSYYDEQNHTHQVWMLDAVTAYNELRAPQSDLGCRGPRFGGMDRLIRRCGRFGMRFGRTRLRATRLKRFRRDRI